MALSSQDRFALKQAAELGILSEAALQEVLLWDEASREAAAALVHDAARARKQRISVGAFVDAEAIALQELEAARREVSSPGGLGRLKNAEAVLNELRKMTAEAATPAPPHVVDSSSFNAMPDDARAALDLLAEMQEVGLGFLRTATPSRLTPNAALSEQDANLCLQWDNVAIAPERSSPSALHGIGDLPLYRALQLLSARNAEKVAREYYERLGFDVVDISQSQLDPASTDWKDFDLLTSERPVDVKNARESFHGLGHFVEHCIPSFKQARRSGLRVRIAGVVSPYVTNLNAYFLTPQPATFLGEVDAEDAQAAGRWAKARFGAKLDLQGLYLHGTLTPGFLPGWMFEYPSQHYPTRAAAIARVGPTLRRLIECWAYSSEIPGWMWVMSDEPVPATLPAANLIADLRELRDGIGLSRRSLYILALGLAVEALVDPAIETDSLQMLRATCRINSADGTRRTMLGLDDPLDYVNQLVELLSSIVRHVKERQFIVRGFRLIHPAILKGLLANGREITLVAYCGGWLRVPVRARCGQTPLSIAKHGTCTTCGHLICDKCGHCSGGCEQCAPRQLASAHESERRLKTSSGHDWPRDGSQPTRQA